ncbi:hypothetical protein [Paracidobacterium acidisoli]|uniref:hypothetical protein n=1 Tax=Paracidobacterium acidisoli TaxID=2303751 RepID=UPI001314F6E9|nr:hypothetical protein [Paracidobacterium acidisoli]MBT9332922.1 hypothetical protein [Paracidobacterium acidisoli]
MLTPLETDPSLFEPDQLARRIDALDELDFLIGSLGSAPSNTSIHARAIALRARIEAANAALYASIRQEIQHGAQPHAVLRWIHSGSAPERPAPDLNPAPGLSYDRRDEIVSGILELQEPAHADHSLDSEMVFYQPTPVRHILALIAAGALGEDDLLVDLGSGLGHVSLLASILSGCSSLGIEVDGSYVASAQACARILCLSRVRFIEGDARTADLSGGTVYYLYTPFTGSMLSDVLGRLRSEGTKRAFRVCTLGPCTSAVAQEPWLTAASAPDSEQITVFRTRS